MIATKAIVTDIEGTTSSIDFVHEVLFPYAACALPDFLRSRQADAEISRLLDEVRDEIEEHDANTGRLVQVLSQWIEEDRKATPLKSLQGYIWADGYESGAFTGHVYADAVSNLRSWRERGIPLYVYSSGSTRAQQLLFGHSDAGDLRPLFSGYFDTRIGGKREEASYRAIAGEIGKPPAEILFLSDVAEELDAAAAAGMQTVQVVRDRAVAAGRHPAVPDFDKIRIQ